MSQDDFPNPESGFVLSGEPAVARRQTRHDAGRHRTSAR
jgi:hypothetical protein